MSEVKEILQNEDKQFPQDNQKTSKAKIIGRLLIYLGILAVMQFWIAGTIRWMWGWIFWGVYALVTMASALLVDVDEELEEERTQMKDDVKSWDKVLASGASILFPFSFLIVGSLDQRFGWTGYQNYALWLKFAAIVVSVLGYGYSMWAARVNKFYARFMRIQKERGHHPITTGPYQIVRHPGYAGLIWFVLAAAILLESYWALIPSGIIVILLVIRTALEDRTLQEELEGYLEYTHKTRYRLFPGIW
ncbi:MAG: methyltransferase family protein [Anaerolineales bacterium]